jgi:hypothetical protein
MSDPQDEATVLAIPLLTKESFPKVIQICRDELRVNPEDSKGAIRRAIPRAIQLLATCASNPGELEYRTKLENLLFEVVEEPMAAALLGGIAQTVARDRIRGFANDATSWNLTGQDAVMTEPFVEEAFDFILKATQTLTTNLVIGSHEFPEPARLALKQAMLPTIRKLLEEPLDGTKDEQLFYLFQMLHCLAQGAKVFREPEIDISGVYYLIQRFANATWYQESRNLAETALLHLRTLQRSYISYRTCLSWFCIAESFLRSGQPLRAAFYFCLAFAVPPTEIPLNWDWCYLASRHGARIARDLRQLRGARAFCELQREVVAKTSVGRGILTQIEVLELSVQVIEDCSVPPRLHQHLQTIVALLDSAPENEHLALLTLAANAIRILESTGGAVEHGTRASIASKLASYREGIAGPIRAMMERKIDINDLRQLLDSAGVAIYREDLAGQSFILAPACLNALQRSLDTRDSDLFLLAATMLSQPTIAAPVQQRQAGRANDERWRELLAQGNVSSAELSNAYVASNFKAPGEHSLAILKLLDAKRLQAVLSPRELCVTIAVNEGGTVSNLQISGEHIGVPEIVDAEHWCPSAYDAWKERFPVRYSDWLPPDPLSGETLPEAEVRESLRQLSPGRLRDADLVTVVPAPKFFGFPFNLLGVTNGEDLLSKSSVCIAPSAAWLIDSRSNQHARSSVVKSWLGSPATPHLDLAIFQEMVRPALRKHDVEEVRSGHPSGDLVNCGLAIVASHGGTGLLGYFNSVTNGLVDFSPQEFSDEFKGVGCAVLFVCSSGVAHQQRHTSEALGLATALLRSGVQCVVACPYPLVFDLPPIWLEGFLPKALGGENMASAAKAGSDEIRARYTNPAAWGALHVYGNGVFRLAV